MFTSFFRKAMLSGTFVPGVYGSRGAAGFVLDAVLQNESLDCLWIGDSNTGYNGWGWADGFQHGLSQAGANMYATAIVFPWNAQPEIGYRSRTFSSFDTGTAQGLVEGTSVSSGASAALKATYAIGSGSLSATGTTTGGAPIRPNFVDVPATRTGDGYTGTALWLYMRRILTGGGAADVNASFGAPCPIGFNSELKFRAQVNIRTGGTGKFTSRWCNTAGSALTGTGVVATQSTTTVSASADVWDTYVHTLAANSTRFIYPGTSGAEYLQLFIDGGGVGAANAVKALTSVGCCSVYRDTVGTSNSIMEFRGGATLTDLAFDISQAAPVGY